MSICLDEIRKLAEEFGPGCPFDRPAGELGIDEAARRLQASRKDVLEWLARGRLEGVARRGVVFEKSVDSLLAECKGVRQ